MKHNPITKSLLACGLVALIGGCSTIKKSPDSHPLSVNPVPAFDVGNIKYYEAQKNTDVDTKISDEKVYKFVHYLKDTLRKKVKQGRRGEESFATIQVVFAAFASAFSASTGVHPDVVTALSGLSALSPDLASIVSPGDKAVAYSQALDLIEAADALYLQNRAQINSDATELVPSDQLSPQGAALFVSTVSSLKVMRDALLNTIPAVEDLEKAMGKYSQFSFAQNQVEVEIESSDLDDRAIKTEMQPQYISEVLRYKGGQIESCSSQFIAVVTVECTSADKDRIVLTPLRVGKSKISVISEKGELSTLEVNVKPKA